MSRFFIPSTLSLQCRDAVVQGAGSGEFLEIPVEIAGVVEAAFYGDIGNGKGYGSSYILKAFVKLS